jgi:hypothetical protein
MRKCTCSENYQVVPEFHNCLYVMRRNGLIPIAEEYAIKNSTSDGVVDPIKFTLLFSKEMDRLAREKELV